MRLQTYFLVFVVCLVSSQSFSENHDLHKLIKSGDVAAFEQVLSTNPSLDVLDEHKRSLLQRALLENNTDIVALLISKGVDAHAKSLGFKKRPLFHIAVEKGNLEAVRMLIDAGADPNATDSTGKNAIDYAIVHYEPTIVEFLLQRGAKFSDSEDPLLSAVTNRDREMVVLLLQAGARYSQTGLIKTQCAWCHGLDGSSTHSNIGHLDGQHLDYLIKQLQDFRSGKRLSMRNERMNRVMHAMTDDMIILTANYYSGLPNAERKFDSSEIDPQMLDRGKELFQEGSASLDLPACISCHGMPATTTESTLTPKIHGLKIAFIEAQLHRFKKGIRSNDEDGVMRSIAAKLSEEQIAELARYIWSLGAEEYSP